MLPPMQHRPIRRQSGQLGVAKPRRLDRVGYDAQPWTRCAELDNDVHTRGVQCLCDMHPGTEQPAKRGRVPQHDRRHVVCGADRRDASQFVIEVGRTAGRHLDRPGRGCSHVTGHGVGPCRRPVGYRRPRRPSP